MANTIDYKHVKIFISHSEDDSPIVDLFIDQILRLGIGVDAKDIFYSSNKGMDVKNGDDFREAIGSAIKSAKITFLFISPNFQVSEVCLNEMGAAWCLGNTVKPLIFGGVKYETAGILYKVTQIEKINEEGSLSKIYEEVSKEMGFVPPKVPVPVWDGHKKTFLAEYEKVVKLIKFKSPTNPAAFELLKKTNTELCQQLETCGKALKLSEEKSKELIDAKTPQAVGKVVAKYTNQTEHEKFEILNEEVRKALTKFYDVVAAYILCDCFGLPYDPRIIDHKEELDDAIREEVLELVDDSDFRPQYDDPDVEKLKTALDNLLSFIDDKNEGGNDEFIEWFKKRYGCKFDCRNQKYWNKVFEFNPPI